jgi:hypothetical protein
MYNLQEITAKILNTPPYQLPPIIHTSGVYQIDVRYRGISFHKVSPQLEDCMSGYFDFVVRVNDKKRFRATDFDKVPVKMGSNIPSSYKIEANYNVIEEKEVSNG